MIFFYRVEFKPLAPYTFGTEQGLKFDGANETGKESYIATSNLEPDQTTLLGTLRYLVLRKKGFLNTDFNYKDKEKQDSVKAFIGGKSFQFQFEAKQEFGVINKISPIFLWDGKSIFIKNPFCNSVKDGYVPFAMGQPIVTSKGKINLPTHKDDEHPNGYDAKEGYAGGYIELSQKKRTICDEKLFRKVVLPGNQIVFGNKNEVENAFFKREAVVLDDEFSFAVFMESSEKVFNSKENTIAYMGKTGNPFGVVFHELQDKKDADLENKVKDAFAGVSDVWHYALSDLYPTKFDYKHFCIVEEKYVRNLETNLSGDEGYVKKRVKNERIHLIRRGSVFYEEEPNLGLNTNLQIAGYNVIVKLGGTK